MKLADLKKPFPRNLISWRIGAMSKDKTKAIALAYIDARDVMERLDEVCGAGNWQALHPHANGKTSCKIGIKIDGEWVWKENGCGDSQVEAEKGAFSDSLKRAAVLWGVGRYLYDVPNVWVAIDQYKKIQNPNDPRLSKALEAAEKGIRLPNEPEPDEQTLLLDGINNCEAAEFATWKDNAKAAWSRMDKKQRDLITAAIRAKEAALTPMQEAAE